jgi:hypothetical protein
MHEFALLAFGGLVTALAVRMVSQYGREISRASNVVLWMGLGVGYAYLVDFSIFTAWDMSVRSHAIGAIITGFMVGGFALLWEEAIDFFRGYAHKDHAEPKKTLRRAA